jgi:transposase-like protein
MKKQKIKTICPACKSLNIQLVEKQESNGIIGPGFSSWVVDSYYSCQDCGCRFDKVK